MFRYIAISALVLCKIVSAHVSLTFPPARKYDLDFLDTARQVFLFLKMLYFMKMTVLKYVFKAIDFKYNIFRTGTLNGSPCGMNRGNATLDLSAKDKINVTWHLGYPHKGT